MSAQRDETLPPAPEPLAVAVVDSHCHLDMSESFPVADALAAAKAVGVERVIQIGCDLAGARWSVATAREHADVWAGIALHPNEAPRLAARSRAALDDAFAEIAALATDPAVRAVG